MLTLNAVAAVIRDTALALPDVFEDTPWGELVFKTKAKKVFVFLAMGKDELKMSVKLTTLHAAAMAIPRAEPTGYGLGKSGWVTLLFAKADVAVANSVLDLVLRCVAESYTLVAHPIRKKKKP
jgi:predicted DNA-binding protein (MmcQ/YjbR family)